jgi:hypothetical protein
VPRLRREWQDARASAAGLGAYGGGLMQRRELIRWIRRHERRSWESNVASFRVRRLVQVAVGIICAHDGDWSWLIYFDKSRYKILEEDSGEDVSKNVRALNENLVGCMIFGDSGDPAAPPNIEIIMLNLGTVLGDSIKWHEEPIELPV